jgi:hypothetical protein
MCLNRVTLFGRRLYALYGYLSSERNVCFHKLLSIVYAVQLVCGIRGFKNFVINIFYVRLHFYNMSISSVH